MKMLLVIAATLMAVNANAGSDSNDLQREAQQLFDSMSATEALYSRKFHMTAENIHVPGSSTWFNPSSLCINGNSIQTVRAVKTGCTAWQGRNDDNEVVNFTDLSTAKRVTGDNFPTCTQPVTGIVSSPLTYVAASCGKWAVRDDGDVKYFSSKSRASDVGTPWCVEPSVSHRTISKNFTVNFYRSVAHNENRNKRHLGSHTFALPNCGSTELPPIDAE